MEEKIFNVIRKIKKAFNDAPSIDKEITFIISTSAKKNTLEDTEKAIEKYVKRIMKYKKKGKKKRLAKNTECIKLNAYTRYIKSKTNCDSSFI
jgi:hypothetical protein